MSEAIRDWKCPSGIPAVFAGQLPAEGPASFSYEVPEDYNPTASKLAALAAKREQACKLFADSVREIDAQISKLTAISNEVAA